MENNKTLKELLHNYPRPKRLQGFWEICEALSEHIEKLEINQSQRDEIIKNIDALVRIAETESFTTGRAVAEKRANTDIRRIVERIGHLEKIEAAVKDIEVPGETNDNVNENSVSDLIESQTKK